MSKGKQDQRASPRRVLHVTEAPLGGVATYLEDLLSLQTISMPDTRFDLISPEINREVLTPVRARNFRFIGFEHRRGSVWSLVGLGWRTIRHIRRTRPEIVHIHSTFAGAVVRGLTPFIPQKTKVVYCPHGWAFLRQGRPQEQRRIAMVERILSRWTDRIVCVSHNDWREGVAAGIPEERLIVVENGVSARSGMNMPRPPRETGPKLIAFVGRFDRQKGFDIFIEVMRRLEGKARGVAIGGAIVKDSEMPEPPPNVDILGWQPRDKAFDLYRRADLLLMPSRWEGLGLVAVEAMQARLAVFASRIGGLKGVVVDGLTGRLFTPDAVDEIVALIAASSDDELRAYGEQGFLRYRNHYTTERVAAEIAALYDDLLGD
ncbi:MAG: glycosyltransferase family 4 protein [Paracoccus sp. (in: a-proteobacteria)]